MLVWVLDRRSKNRTPLMVLVGDEDGLLKIDSIIPNDLPSLSTLHVGQAKDPVKIWKSRLIMSEEFYN